jgi:oxygen-independent coproporphyrinogen-3 oxidase
MSDSPSPQIPCRNLYLHVPFCARKCAYCAFYSEASNGEAIERYVAALIREIELVAGQVRPETVFFGGGTPSLLTVRQWDRILRATERLHLTGAAEWTVECNPATLSLDKAKRLRDGGVNRISMGVQSLDETLLEQLGRVHTRAMAFKSFDLLRQAGFDNLNLDLMFAIPGQSLEAWGRTLDEAIALGSEHLSCYEVIYEEDTPLFARLQAGEIDEDEDLACAMYEQLIDRAGQAGFQQYEIANFARDLAPSTAAWNPRPPVTPPLHHPHPPTLPNSQTPKLPNSEPPPLPSRACRHNVNYWRGGSFLGLGPSATSYLGGVRTRNWSNTQRYCEELEQGRRAMESREELSPLARAGETAAFGLRMVAGWPFEEFHQVTGHDLRGEWAGDMNQLAGYGWGRIDPDRFRLTREGLRFADAAAELFLR